MQENLYDIRSDLLAALNAVEVDEETGEVLNFEQLEQVNALFDDKAENVACYIKDRVRFAADLKAEEEMLYKRRKSIEKKVNFLTGYLTKCMNDVGKDFLETPRALLKFRRSTQVQIDDEKALLPEYIVETVTTRPDKIAIKKAIQDGKEVSGASLVENRTLQIK